jgi:hypothetical protein
VEIETLEHDIEMEVDKYFLELRFQKRERWKLCRAVRALVFRKVDS